MQLIQGLTQQNSYPFGNLGNEGISGRPHDLRPTYPLLCSVPYNHPFLVEVLSIGEFCLIGHQCRVRRLGLASLF